MRNLHSAWTKTRSLMLRSLSVAVLSGSFVLPVEAAAAQGASQTTVVATHIMGKVEQLLPGNIWRPLKDSAAIPLGLRTGAGRALLTTDKDAGSTLVGSASQVRVYQDEPDLLSGQFYLRGPATAHILGEHIAVSQDGRARVDIGRKEQRIAALNGTVRVTLRQKGSIILRAGQQISLFDLKVTPYQEKDPWYAAQFVSEGEVTLEAFRGKVTLRRENKWSAATNNLKLQGGDFVNTGADAWAEIGFQGGGYLRLQANSELQVIAVERTNRGRTVILQLTKGSAWNVVQKGQGGYKITTPVISTAVRGTVYRVDADGGVKVFEGSVEVPGEENRTTLQAGQQLSAQGVVGALVSDEQDALNQSLDAQRQLPLTLQVTKLSKYLKTAELTIEVPPSTEVQLWLDNQPQTLQQVSETEKSRTLRFTLNLQSGIHTLKVTATRYGKTLSHTQQFTVDLSAPTLAATSVRQGIALVISGTLGDDFGQTVTLSTLINDQQYSRYLAPGVIQWILPAPTNSQPTQITLTDEAGNTSHVTLP